MAHQTQKKEESPEQKFTQKVVQSYGSCTVRLQMEIHDKHGTQNCFTGTGFVVYIDDDLCLIMSCGHNFEGYRVHSAMNDAIYVEFSAKQKLKAELVFMDVEKEVSMIRVDRDQINHSIFYHIRNCPALHWSPNEAPLHELVAILSYMNDPDGNPIFTLSAYSGTVIRKDGVIKFGGSTVRHDVTADYACTQGNSGSPVVNLDGAVGIHMGGTAQLAYFISLAGVKAVLKEQVAKIGSHNSDDIAELIRIITVSEKKKGPGP